MSSFECKVCGREFTVPEQTLAKYPAWKPKQCMPCRAAARAAGAPGGRTDRGKGGSSTSGSSRRTITRERDLTLQEVLDTFDGGPKSGVFTDGASHPNPGPGGWGAVYVIDDEIVGQAKGAAEETTNNRMELTALIEGFRLVPLKTKAKVHTDSRLCVDTITKWADGWRTNGWKRKGGPIKNLDLVKELYALAKERPELELQWIRAHSGNRWNEYADSLATAYRRSSL